MNRELLKLLQEIRMERDFNTIAICQASADDCVFDNILKEISMPVVLLNKRLAYTYKAQFSKELLILLCLHQSSVTARLTELSVFRSLKQTRIVAYAPHVTDLELVKQYCLDAMANDIYNVLIIQRDFSATQNYYTCNKFPLDAPRYKQKSLKLPGMISSAIFEQQFQNMYGTPILIYPDQLEPRSMLYYKPDGNVEVEGYIGRTLRVFAARRNTTLFINHPYKVGKSVFYGVLQELAENGTIDIAAGMTFVTPNDDLEKLSYPVQTMDYCYMVPLPENVPINQLFFAIELAENGTIDIAAGMRYVKPNDDMEKLTYPVQTMDYCYMVPLPENVPVNELYFRCITDPLQQAQADQFYQPISK
ncbi:uncharacterized protein LOC118746488 [Rhagoletis pomonella]|uniref:uncharacterized protein LOC118746488 n=1 Tax=Rhagoletis pomonella TaxID=28610 RepID=UPI0017821969|nr:uncharacterized protein LOC118746488 [Rhagoletis pomonella]